jgi:CRISPR-associated protein Cas2
MTRGVRERVWNVLGEWHRELGGGSIVMTYRDLEAPGRQAVLNLGDPPRELAEVDGMLLVRRETSAA